MRRVSRGKYTFKRALYKSKSQARAVGASACIYKANRQNEKPDARHAVKKL